MDELFAICRASMVPDGKAVGFTLMRKDETGTGQPWPIIITRKGNNFFGFENACPHQGTRLDAFPNEFMDEEENFLVCGKHRAQFDLDTGHCFIGPCQGKDLPRIDLIVDDGDLCISGIDLADEDGMDLVDHAPEVMITPE